MDDDFLKYLPRTEWSHPESVAGFIWKLRKRQMDYDEFFQELCKFVIIFYGFFLNAFYA